jgi:hypothetical protein
MLSRQNHRPPDLLQHLQRVSAQHPPCSASGERSLSQWPRLSKGDDVKLVGEVWPVFFQKTGSPPPCSINTVGGAVNFPVPSTATRPVLDAAKLDGLRFARGAHGRPLGWPRALTLPSE